MPRLQLIFDPRYFSSNNVRISTDSGNAFVFDADGVIKLMTTSGSQGNTRNTPGNAIDGTVGQSIPIIRLDSSVTRKVGGDPTPSNEGILVTDLVSHILE